MLWVPNFRNLLLLVKICWICAKGWSSTRRLKRLHNIEMLPISCWVENDLSQIEMKEPLPSLLIFKFLFAESTCETCELSIRSILITKKSKRAHQVNSSQVILQSLQSSSVLLHPLVYAKCKALMQPINSTSNKLNIHCEVCTQVSRQYAPNYRFIFVVCVNFVHLHWYAWKPSCNS